jgi:hypothetical protein
VKSLGVDSVNLCVALFRSRARLAAENLFLRKQLALFQEREKKARPTTAADRFVLCRLAWPHRSRGPGIPVVVQTVACERDMRPFSSSAVIAKPILGGLHHEYRREKAA